MDFPAAILPQKKISFAEDHPVRIGVTNQRLSISDRFVDAVTDQGSEICNRLGRDQANGDLRGAGVERGAERFPALVGDRDQGTRLDAVAREYVGPVDPNVAGLETGSTSRGDFDLGDFGLG